MSGAAGARDMATNAETTRTPERRSVPSPRCGVFQRFAVFAVFGDVSKRIVHGRERSRCIGHQTTALRNYATCRVILQAPMHGRLMLAFPNMNPAGGDGELDERAAVTPMKANVSAMAAVKDMINHSIDILNCMSFLVNCYGPHSSALITDCSDSGARPIALWGHGHRGRSGLPVGIERCHPKGGKLQPERVRQRQQFPFGRRRGITRRVAIKAQEAGDVFTTSSCRFCHNKIVSRRIRK